MPVLILGEVPVQQTIAEQRGLPKGEAKSLSGDSVHSAGGIAHQHRAAAIHAGQSSGYCDCAPFAGSGFRIFEARVKFRKFPEPVFQPQLRAGRDQRHANFFLADGRDVNLALMAPMQFHEIGPGRDPVVAPEGESQILFRGRVRPASIQSCPVADAGTASVGAHHPARADEFSSHQRAFGMEAGDRGLP